MKKYFIPHKAGVAWSRYFLEDAELQNWRMLIIGKNNNTYQVYRSPEYRDTGIGYWEVMENWGKVVEEIPFQIKIEDDLFTLGE